MPKSQPPRKAPASKAKRGNPSARPSVIDKINGVVRDPVTGIVLTRTIRHPLADLFMSAPMGPGLPGLALHPFPEISQILAIHLFDNLDCSPPRNPLYKFRHDIEAQRSVGLPAAKWVSINTPDPEPVDPEASAAAAAELDAVVDITDYSDAQVEALEAQIKQRKLTAKLVGNLDPHVRENLRAQGKLP